MRSLEGTYPPESPGEDWKTMLGHRPWTCNIRATYARPRLPISGPEPLLPRCSDFEDRPRSSSRPVDDQEESHLREARLGPRCPWRFPRPQGEWTQAETQKIH